MALTGAEERTPMSISLRAAARKAGPVLAATAVAAGLATGPAAAAPAAPPPVDHQLCYTATGTFTIPAGIRLINQFSPNSFVPSIRPTLAIHCNPVEKILPTGQVFPITNPNA